MTRTTLPRGAHPLAPAALADDARLVAFAYTTTVLTHGLLGRKEEELDRKELERELNAMGADGWELVKLLTGMNLHGEKDGHVLVFKRRLG